MNAVWHKRQQQWEARAKRNLDELAVELGHKHKVSRHRRRFTGLSYRSSIGDDPLIACIGLVSATIQRFRRRFCIGDD